MLYRTHQHHPFFFHFNHSSPLLPPSTPLRLLTSASLNHQVKERMECVEAALKTSFRPEMAQQQAVSDDFWSVNGQTGGSAEEFLVDDLFDFSNGDISNEEDLEEENEGEEEEKGCTSHSFKQEEEEEEEEAGAKKGNGFNTATSLSAKDEFGSDLASALSVPADDLANLEWLSHFVEDSFSGFSLPFSAGGSTEKPQYKTEYQSEQDEQAKPLFTTPVPAKARSKRTRTGGRAWSLGSPSLTESSTTASVSSSSSSHTSWVAYSNPTQNLEPVCSIRKPPAKKQKRQPAGEGVGGRRCSHCGVQKTPQWRAGPLGAKTLCNACGVRFKSGRLLPEYRPACSPTFSSEIHSNNHRKVLEMRRKKETSGPESGLAPAIQSF